MSNKKDIKGGMKFIYENKNGYKSDFLKKFNNETFESLRITGMIKVVPSFQKDDYSWEISKSGYNWYITANPNLQYKHWTTRLFDFVNYWLHYKWIKKEYLENENRKDTYFK